MHTFLGFDVGGTKTAWGLIDDQGTVLQSGRYPTPTKNSAFLEELTKLTKEHSPTAIGVGIAGTLSKDRQSTLLCTNIPSFSHWDIVKEIFESTNVLTAIDNDARCALIGEVWKGVASDMSSAIFLTVGTGIGGAVMQKGKILAHPQDISKEISRIVADPTDVFPSKSGAGTIEALIGGVNLERRFSISLAEMALKVRKGDEEAVEVWKEISHLFFLSLRAIHNEFSCKNIIVGGIGSNDLSYYLQDTPPCPTQSALLGEKAGIFGAARLAMDAFAEQNDSSWD